jgi:hypothetical protein
MIAVGVVAYAMFKDDVMRAIDAIQGGKKITRLFIR